MEEIETPFQLLMTCYSYEAAALTHQGLMHPFASSYLDLIEI